MNPQDQYQPQNPQDQQDQPAVPDSQVDNQFILATARQMLADEAANPGSQDPDALGWARSIVNSPPAPVPVGDVPLPPAPPIAAQQPGQTIQPTPTEQAASPDGHVLYINRSDDTPPPPPSNNQPNSGGQEQTQ